MWPWADLHKLDEAALRRRGLSLPLGTLWTPGKGGLAQAAVGFGGGCTGSFVSPDGLILTNHHCAYPAIQRNSTPEKNLLSDGLWARSRAEELDGYGLRVYVFRHQRDVTQEIIGDLPTDLNDLDLIQKIEAREKALVARCEEKAHTRCHISRENDGLRFLLLENTELKDVRLVVAPSEALGNYGGEVDNFRWPRHTLDFALARAYVAPDGTPRAYHADNVPYRPKRWLKVEPRGVQHGDLVMVLGTPGRTNRYATSVDVAWNESWHYPFRERLFTDWLTALDEAAKRVPAARIPTASRVRALDNGLTHAKGMRSGFGRRQILKGTREEEARFAAWVTADPGRAARHGKALDALTTYERSTQPGMERDLLLNYMVWGVHLMDTLRTLVKWAHEQDKPDHQRDPGFQERDRDALRSKLEHSQRSFHPEADQAVFALFLARIGGLPQAERPRALDAALGGDYSEGRVRAFLRALYGGTRLNDTAARLAAMDEPLARLKQSPDPALRLGLALHGDLEAHQNRKLAHQGALFRLRRPYLEALIAFRGARFYPDANLTPRVSFAHVAGYSPQDGVWYAPHTTLCGLLAKHTGLAPFALSDSLRRKLEGSQTPGAKDADPGSLQVNFLSNADTTGGNSGSPALNGAGHLVGLNFDRVYENISGDFGYRSETSRNVMVDVRFVLFYIQRILAAEAIMKELGLAEPPRP